MITECDIVISDRSDHWNSFLDDVIKKTDLQFIFLNGGFIAGGFPRIASNDRMLWERKDYFNKGGDVDVFFRDENCFRRCEREIASLSGKFRLFKTTSCSETFVHLHSYRKIQLVKCETGTPSSVISQFDIVNSMVGFDDKRWYSVKGRNDLEKSNLLDLNDMGFFGASLPTRLLKYLNVWGYDGLTSEAFKVTQDFVYKIMTLPDGTEEIPYLGKDPDRIKPKKVEDIIKVLIKIVPEHDLILLLEKSLVTKMKVNHLGETYMSSENLVLKEIKRREEKRNVPGF